MKVSKKTNKKLASYLIWNKDGTKVAIKEGEKRVVFSDFPEWLNKDFPAKMKWLVTYSGNKISFLSPYTGVYEARFVGFVKEEGKKPTPKTVSRTYDSSTWEETTAIAKFRLVDPKYNGMNVSSFLTLGAKYFSPKEYDRAFVYADENDNMAIDIGKSKKAALLVSFLEAIDILDQDYKYVENPLPIWHKAGRKKAHSGTTVTLVFEKGYVSKILPMDDLDEPDDDTFDEVEDDETENEEDELEGFDDEDDEDKPPF